MRILHLIQKKQLRGAEVFACQLSNHLQQQGHEVKVVALVDGTATLPFDGAVEVLNARLDKKFTDFAGWKKLSNIINEFAPDIVQANAGDTLKYAIFSRMLYRWKSPVVFRNASVISRYLQNPVAKMLTGFLVKRSDHIASVSHHSKEDIMQLFKLRDEQVTVLPIGIEQSEPVQLKEMMEGSIHIVHVGGFTFEKNHAGLLRIFQQFKVKQPQAKLWLVGDGPLKSEMEQLATQMELNDSVIFKGHVSNPLDYIASAKMLVLPSIIEGLPGVIAEAFFCKTPAVSANVGGVADLITDGKTGWLANPGDEEGFANTMEKVIMLPKDELRSVLDNAYQKVTQHFSNQEIAARFATLYEELIKERR